MKIIVLAGGLSPERDVSLISGAGICRTLRERGHQAFLLDVFFLLYCIWLMLHDNTWTPGFLLLVIAALESLAIHARISGAYDEDEEGFVYPRTWVRYLCFGESMFILLRLFLSLIHI